MTDALRSGGRIDVAYVALLIALVILPLYPKVGLLSVSGTYVPIRLDDVVTVAVVVAWAWALARERRLPRIPPIAHFVVAWLAFGLIALVIGAAVLQTIGWATGFLFWAKPIEYLLLGWVAYDLVDRPERFRMMLWVVFLTAAVVLGYAMLERFDWVEPAPNYVYDVSQRRGELGSTMGDQHQMATYLGIVGLVGAALWHRASGPTRLVGLLGLAAIGYVVVHASARSEFLGLLGSAAVLAAWRPARLAATVLALSLVLSFMVPESVERTLDTVFLRGGSPAETATPTRSPAGESPRPTSPTPSGSGATPPSAPPVDVSNRFDDLESDRSLEMRLRERWPMFLRIAARSPIFGAGPSAASEAADGYYIRSFTEVGLVGTTAFIAIIVAVVAWMRRASRVSDRLLAAAAIGFVFATIFTALVGVLIDTWVASRVMQLYWPLAGALLSGAVAGRRSDSLT